MLRLVIAAAALLGGLLTPPAFAATFACITPSAATDCGIGEAQLTLDIIDEGPGLVRFRFNNSGPLASVVSEIYFDDGSLLDIASIVNGTGVSFVEDASPPDLPGGNNAVPPFQVTAGFLAEATPSAPTNGVGPGEFVSIIFSLQSGATYNDVLTQFGNGTVRAGVHVIAFTDGGSVSLVNNPVPEPGTASLLAAGLACVVALRRRS